MARDFGVVAERLRRSTVRVREKHGGGSGVLWRDGLVITNAHVARRDRVVVELWDGREFEARVKRRDLRRDLALLTVTAGDGPEAEVGDSSGLRAGQIVLAVGNPMGFLGALSTGVIHGQGPVEGLGRQSWVQADIRLAPGNSGGPLADAEGRVIGINTMIAAGLALAVPSNAVAAFLAQRETPALGVVLRPLREGLLVLEVSPNSPAALASLLPGDLLVGVNGRGLRSADDLYDAMAGPAVLVLNFTRGGRSEVREVAVRLRAEAA